MDTCSGAKAHDCQKDQENQKKASAEKTKEAARPPANAARASGGRSTVNRSNYLRVYQGCGIQVDFCG
jgi:hypothetical protein